MDVRNSRGIFDEIKEKFVINPAPIASQSSLNTAMIVALILPHRNRDHVVIGPRSHHDRGSCLTSICLPIEIR